MIIAAGRENDSSILELGYCYLGRTYARDSANDKDRDFHRTDSLLKRCLDISLIRRDSMNSSLAYGLMGWNFYLEKRYNEAIDYYNKTLNYSIPTGIISFTANAYGNLGTIYRDLGNNDKSIKYYLKSIEEAQKIEDVYNLQGVYRDMSELYLKKGDTSNAFKSYVLYKKYSDAMLGKIQFSGDCQMQGSGMMRTHTIKRLNYYH